MPRLPLFLLCLLPISAWADSMRCDGDLVEYTAFVSTIIPAKVAAADGIVRANDRIITNVTVLHHHKSIQASVKGTATNLLNQVFELSFRPVREHGTVYYLAMQMVNPRDTLTYALSVHPQGSVQSCEIHFIRDYYRAGSP